MLRFINAGVSGDTTKGGLARLDWALFEGADKAPLLPLAAMICCAAYHLADSYSKFTWDFGKIAPR